jgi:para-aminobenzoate synthetase component 2
VDSTVPADLIVTSRTVAGVAADGTGTMGGVIMGVQHATLPIYGVQFHPESVLTQDGYQMLGNWLESVGLAGAAETAKGLSPMVRF